MSASKVPTPIFVLGKHRSGTTGLANHLCEHPAIAGVQHESHFGIKESGYFEYVAGRYGPLSYWPNYRAFVEVMSASDYFRLTGIEKEYMLALWPTTYSDFFETVMKEFAGRQEAKYWIEKSPAHTKEALRLAEEYPEARFVAIIRDIEDVVASSLFHNNGRENTESKEIDRIITISRVVRGWVYYKKLIYDLERNYPSRTKLINYEDFCLNKKKVLDNISDFLQVDYEESICNTPYSRNSSFEDSKMRSEALTETEKKYCQIFCSLINKIPLSMYKISYIIYDYFRDKKNFPESYFRISDKDVKSK